MLLYTGCLLYAYCGYQYLIMKSPIDLNETHIYCNDEIMKLPRNAYRTLYFRNILG